MELGLTFWPLDQDLAHCQMLEPLVFSSRLQEFEIINLNLFALLGFKLIEDMIYKLYITAVKLLASAFTIY